MTKESQKNNLITRIIGIESIDKHEWHNFISNISESTYFTTTDYWQNFDETHILQIIDNNNEILAGIPYRLISLIPLIGKYFRFCRIDSSILVKEKLDEKKRTEIKKLALQSFIEYLKTQKVVFLYMSPMTRSHDSVLLKEVGFVNDRCATLTIDLSNDEDVIYKSFSSNNRNKISNALKNGVKIRIYEGESALSHISEYIMLQNKLFEHKKNTYSEIYYKNELYLKSIFSSKYTKSYLAIAYYHNEPAAAAILISYKHLIYYYLGASDYKLVKDSKASNLLQFETIKFAKKSGYLIYDFGGIPFKSDPSFEIHGVYIFKKSFGGIRQKYDIGNYVISKFKYKILWQLNKNQSHPIIRFTYKLFNSRKQ